MKFSKLFSLLFISSLFSVSQGVFAQLNTDATKGVIERTIPSYAKYFKVESLSDSVPKDEFEIESTGKLITLRGNNGVAVASALYYYLTNYCHCQITWNGEQLDLPKVLPTVKSKIHKKTPYQYRYYLNYCTYNYSMSWWNWDRWQKEIDWMALHGINMPLAITGEEYTWYEVYKNMGFTDNDLKDFFCGPAYFGWFWMGNLDGWGGPLSMHWMTSHRDLQQKIVQQERDLGMKPVLPAFTGHVPAAFKKRYPNAKLKTTNWSNGFGDTYILDSEDPMFAELGKKFLELQTQLYGTDHLYSADTFNENEPPSDDPTYLAQLSKRIYEGMRDADTAAVWVMQGWLFFSDRKFWKSPQIEALLNAVPNDKMIVLDLMAEYEPIWKRTKAFYGKPWIWNQLNNFGGNVNLFGRMDTVAVAPAQALNDPNSGNLKGIGLTMEAISNNPVMYELMMDHTWRNTPIDLKTWLPAYIYNRYKSKDSNLLEAWNVLHHTVYNGQLIRDGAESIITGRPTLDSATVWTRTKLNYKAADLLPAWDGLIKASKKINPTAGFKYDLVDVSRQVLANYAQTLQQDWVKAYRQKNKADFSKYTGSFLELMDDMDLLLGSQKDFLLGPWLEDAKSCGITQEEKDLYEQNARDLLTLWGDANSPLHEYANRQWSGLIKGFYKPRWQQYFDMIQRAWSQNETPDWKGFDTSIKQWEWNWVLQHNAYPTSTNGDAVALSQAMYHKYHTVIGNAYRMK